MIPSRYNQITPLEENSFAIFNPLSGAFDIADEETKNAFQRGLPPSPEEKEAWLSRGYFFETPAEEKMYLASRYEEFLKETEKNQSQFLIILSYGCNFRCAYCYQKGIETREALLSEEMLRAFVQYVRDYRDENNKEVTVSLFGGEPLLPAYRERISLLIELLGENHIPLSVVTNGYHLEEYVDLLKRASIQEIHVSLDGDQSVHDLRRFPKEGEGSFEKIMKGISKAIDAGFPLHVRLIIDRITLETLPALAEKFESRGWLDLPKNLFKTSFGRNYELINASTSPENLFAQDEMYAAYVEKMKKHPLLQKLHQPSFFGITQMIRGGEMYLPSFDTCPGAKSEFVCDQSGQIFSCTASCGREGYAIGRYFPEVVFDREALKKWQMRSILTIDKCRDCSVGVVCGGGCAVLAKEKSGDLLAPNCKPVKEVMDLGIRFYKEVLLEGKK
ncbi:MAG TPA: radical SAM/SPASM domain-containing protein [Cyanobacteria bacterium UBA8530]|nr:radical SAM/SPASM domain-containing protein [Cyanobacteria bacterium UBA8530]